MISIESLAALAAALFVKHLLADGPLQTPYQLANKGRFLHPGGLLHSGLHVGFTGVVLLLWGALVGRLSDVAALLSFILIAEFVIHYTTDWLKCRADTHFAWSCTEITADGAKRFYITDSMYFIAFLMDQTVHSLTYVWIIYAIGSHL